MHSLSNNRGKRGIALIMVLGILSVFVIMIVTLLITARTERLVSETAQDNTRARHLAKTALADAMDYLDNQLWGDNKKISLPKAKAILPSQGTDPVGTSLGLISGDVTNYLPRRYLLDTDPDYNATNKEVNIAQWIYIRDDHDQGNYIGRYAYLCFDCTGLLDINLIAAGQHRGGGTSIGEIDLTQLPDAQEEVESCNENLRANRALYHRFDTLKEIIHLNDGLDDIASAIEQNVIYEPELNNLTPYSLCYDNGWWNWSANSWQQSILGVPIDVRGWNQTQAEAAFVDAGYSTALPMARCFVDYVDIDSRPQSVNIPCCESVPMINEVRVRNEVDVIGANLEHRVYFDVELWNPVTAPTPNTLTYEVEMSAPTWTIRSTTGIEFAPNTPDTPKTFTCVAGVQYYEVSFRFTRLVPLADLGGGDVDIRATSIINLPIVVREGVGGPEVDSIGTQGQNLRLPPLPLDSGFPQSLPVAAAVGMSATDPRVNHLTSDWAKKTVTWKAENEVDNFATNATTGDLEGKVIYVRNDTNMESVAELGFIPTGLPWETIDLFTPQGRTLLAKYRTTTNYTGVANGFVNPNTLYPDVLTAIFTNTPIPDFPGQTPPSAVLSDRDLIDFIVTGMLQASEYPPSGAGSFDSSAAWGTIPALGIRGDLSRLGLSNNQKEAIIRNSYGLFNANQNLFTIVVVAQALNDQGAKGTWEPAIDSVVGEKRAVAVVWRDPFPSAATTRSEQFIQFFRWLDE